MTKLLSLSPPRSPRRRAGFAILAGVIILAAALYGLFLNAGAPAP